MNFRMLRALCVSSVLFGCSGGESDEPEPQMEAGVPEASPAVFVLESSAFENGGTIPPEHRCSGTPSPPLRWSGSPSGTQSYAVIMRDLNFMNGFLHWIIYDIPASSTELPEGVPVGYEPGAPAPAGAKQASLLGQGYFGPCSPSTTNTYEFTLHALGVPSLEGLTSSSDGAEVVARIEEHTLAETALEGTSGP